MCNVRQHEGRELWVKQTVAKKLTDVSDWEHLDTESEDESAWDMLKRYANAFGPGFEFEIRLPDHHLNDAEEVE